MRLSQPSYDQSGGGNAFSDVRRCLVDRQSSRTRRVLHQVAGRMPPVAAAAFELRFRQKVRQ